MVGIFNKKKPIDPMKPTAQDCEVALRKFIRREFRGNNKNGGFIPLDQAAEIAELYPDIYNVYLDQEIELKNNPLPDSIIVLY